MTPMTLTVYRTSWARSKPNGGLQCLAAESVLKSLCRRALLTVDSSSSCHRVHRQIESADQHTQKGGGQIQRYTDRKTVGHTRQERDREVVKVGKQGERRQTSTNTNATKKYTQQRNNQQQPPKQFEQRPHPPNGKPRCLEETVRRLHLQRNDRHHHSEAHQQPQQLLLSHLGSLDIGVARVADPVRPRRVQRILSGGSHRLRDETSMPAAVLAEDGTAAPGHHQHKRHRKKRGGVKSARPNPRIFNEKQ